MVNNSKLIIKAYRIKKRKKEVNHEVNKAICGVNFYLQGNNKNNHLLQYPELLVDTYQTNFNISQAYTNL